MNARIDDPADDAIATDAWMAPRPVRPSLARYAVRHDRFPGNQPALPPSPEPVPEAPVASGAGASPRRAWVTVAAWAGTVGGGVLAGVALWQGVPAHPWAFGTGAVVLCAGLFGLIRGVPALPGPRAFCPECGRPSDFPGNVCDHCNLDARR